MRRRTGAWSFVAIAVFVAAACAACSAEPGPAPYAANEETIANPERGFYHQPGRCDKDLFSPSALATYRADEHITLVLCDFYLTNEDESPNLTNSVIRPQQLDILNEQARRLRAAGAKMILRFAYTDTCPKAGCVQYDPAPEIVHQHIAQLAPLVAANSDVISVLQEGFIGLFGEGAYSNHFGTTPHVTTTEWGYRNAVLRQLLELAPARMVQVRTPLMKTQLLGTGALPVSDPQAYSAEPIARIGHHNDCFLRNLTDSGTYDNFPGDRSYLAADSTYVAVGGETCAAVSDPVARSSCATALSEMATYHYAFLNQDYRPEIIAKWTADNCKAEMNQRLGYRFSLTGATVPTSVKQGTSFAVDITIRNSGWADLYNARRVYLVLRDLHGRNYPIPLSADPRRWAAGADTHIQQNVPVPPTMPPGRYVLFLNLPDATAALAHDPRYSIQLATNDVWEESTGFNRLKRVLRVTA